MSDKNEESTKYTDFARSEIYALHRLTITLSTFIITASFAILALGNKSNNASIHQVYLAFFIGTVFTGMCNIVITWIWLKRSLYKFYDKYDKHKYKKLTKEEKERCHSIRKNSKNWELTIWIFFWICTGLFTMFLFIKIFGT